MVIQPICSVGYWELIYYEAYRAEEDARALLQSTQQLRIHWSGVITPHIGYAIMINVAIWSYFLKSYIDSLAWPSTAQPPYIVLGATFSAITLGAWRLYTHYIDNHIAGLYPDFLLLDGEVNHLFNSILLSLSLQ